MNWTNEIKQEFRKLLISFYPSPIDLEMFVSDAIGKNLAEISPEEKLEVVAFKLIQWAESHGRLDKLFEAFCEDSPDRPNIDRLKNRLVGDRFIDKTMPTIDPDDWEKLFATFSQNDLLEIAKACHQAFKDCFDRELEEIYPHCPRIEIPNGVREILETYDDPKIAVAFANRTIALIQKLEDGDRDVSKIVAWRDRIAQTHQVDPHLGIPKKSQLAHGYLLVSVQPQATGVHLFAELHFADDRLPEPIDLDPNNLGIFCEFSGDGDVEISRILQDPLSKLIEKAELKLIDCQGKVPVTIEIFLPLEYLDRRVHEWQVMNELQQSCQLGEHRAFIVRSLDRARKPILSSKIKSSWTGIREWIDKNQIDRYCLEIDAPICDGLETNLLLGKLGVKLAAGLPEDRAKRQSVLSNLVTSAIPFAFWVHEVEFECCQTVKAFNSLFIAQNLTNFSKLATAIQEQRVRKNPIYHLGMLCDCPERMPTLPGQTQVPRARIPS